MAALRAAVFQQAALRHARFYLQQLQLAHEYYHGQQMHLALAIFDEHWSQIQAAFEGLMRLDDELEALRLGNDYVHFGINLLTMRRPVAEQITWLNWGLQAARLVDDPQNEFAYLNNLGQAYLISKSLDLSLHYHEQALTLAQTQGDQKYQADALVGVGRVTSLMPGRLDAGREYLHTASAMLRTINEASALGWCLQSLGSLEERAGNLDYAETYLHEALVIFETSGDQRLLATTLRRLGSVAERRGDYEQSLAYVEQALTISQALDDLEVITNCLLTMGLIKDMQGESVAAHRLFEEGLAAADRRGNKLNIGVALINLGWSATNLKDFEAALRYHRQSVDLYRSLNHHTRIAAALSNVGFIQVQLGFLEEAAVSLGEALVMLNDTGARDDWLDVIIGFAWLDLRRGEVLQSARMIGMVLANPPAHSYPERTAYLNMIQPELEAALAPIALTEALNQGTIMEPETCLLEIIHAIQSGR